MANDYNSNPARGPVHTNFVHDKFDLPNLRPLFLVINCVSNSTQQPFLQLQLYESNVTDFSAAVLRWRGSIDRVLAPRPRITNTELLTDGTLSFAFLGQRERTNRVECTTNFLNWTVLSNFFGTNAPSIFRDPDATSGPPRFYRVRRL
ncbi:MAG TPA: hypothetical protein VFC26_04600 [Verrucomicrobiae bacterium]|nr:hypothetical protein [Verrucomicrobiae bacterium]